VERIDRRKLKGFKEAGITRVSLGVQSLHEAYLTRFGRIHSADDAREAIREIANAGFNSWNIDLIFGFPGQSFKEWDQDLHEVLTFGAPHLSCYSFSVEGDAPYSKMVQKGLAPLPSEDLQATLFEVTEEVLSQASYSHYEVSNYAQAGFESRHNKNYWNYGNFVGLGAGAVSFLHDSKGPFDSSRATVEGLAQGRRGELVLRSFSEGGRDEGRRRFGYRTTNIKSPQGYMRALLSGDEEGEWFELEEISQETAMAEFMMMGLRLTEGISSQNFQFLFDQSAEEHFADRFKKFRQKGWISREGYFLTKEGHLFSNRVIEEFL